MNLPTEREKLEKIKEELKSRKEIYESIKNSLDDESSIILGPRDELEYQKIKNEIKESKNEK